MGMMNVRVTWLFALMLAARLLVAHAETVPLLADPTKPEQGQHFLDGMADRVAWENWYNGLAGAYRDGATFWSSHRSLPHPSICQPPSGIDAHDYVAGCVAAQQRLVSIDLRRRSQPDYRAGFNTYSPVTMPVFAPSPAPPFSPAPAASAPPSPPLAHMPFGNHHDEVATILSESGTGTAHAMITLRLDRDWEDRACHGESDPYSQVVADCMSQDRVDLQRG